MGRGRLGAGRGAARPDRRGSGRLSEAPEVTSWSARLTELGIDLPQVVAPLAAYVPAVRTGNLVYTAGQLPISEGELRATGKVGAEISAEEAKNLARQCALNALAAIDALVGIDSVVKVVKVVGFVASAPEFGGQPGVINGASELFGRGIR